MGSPFGADRVAWRAADILRGAGLAVECLDRPGPGLLDYLRGRSRVVILDALLGGEPGRLVSLGRAELLRQVGGVSSHAFGVAEALALGDALGELPVHLGIVGIEVGDDAAVEPPLDGTMLLAAVRCAVP